MNKRIIFLCFLMLGLSGALDVKADTIQVYYNEVKDGATTVSVSGKTVAATIVDGSTDTFNDGYYYVEGTDTISSRIEVEGNVTLILGDGATLVCSSGITVGDGTSLTITVGGESKNFSGTGELLATGDAYSAGIGGGEDEVCGTVIVCGGTVTATGGDGGAGIGGGQSCGCVGVTIYGGTVTATGGSKGGAGIGGGGSTGYGGTVTIYGGTVTATGVDGGSGIGGGSSGNGGTVTICGGTVTATGGERGGAGIGGGSSGNGGTVTISGGTVTATGGEYGAGIGSDRAGGTVTISGGTVTATGAGVGIGGGYSGTVTINGGTINATITGNGTAIGSGSDGNSGAVTINGGTVNADASAGSIGIGGLKYNGEVTIKGGEVTVLGGSRAGIGGYNSNGVVSIIGNAAVVTIIGGSGNALSCSSATAIPGTGYQVSVDYGDASSPSTDEGDEGSEYDLLNGTAHLGANKYGKITFGYIVKFETNGGVKIASQTISKIGTAKATKPKNPTRGGYTLENWYADKSLTTLFDFDNPITQDTILYAKWTPITYSIAYEYGSASGATQLNKPTSAQFGDIIEISNPTCEGYVFKGWISSADKGLCVDSAKSGNSESSLASWNGRATTDSFFMNLDTLANKAVTLTATWTPYTISVSLELNGGEGLTTPVDMVYGEVLKIDNPTRSGYVFAGWTSSDINKETAQCGTSESELSSWDGTTATKATYFKNLAAVNNATVTLVANWIEAVTVTFNSNGGSDVDAQIIAIDTEATTPSNPSKLGYDFAGWCSDKELMEEFDFSSKIVQDTTLYAKWTANTIKITIQIDDNTGKDTTMVYDVPLNIENPTREGYIFTGWTATGINSETAMYGKSSEDVSTKWEVDTISDTANVWFKNLASSSNAEVKLIATWVKAVNVTFLFNDDVTADSIIVVKVYSTVAEPANPKRTGYTFVEWRLKDASSAYDFATEVTCDTTLYAVWEVNKYTVLYTINDSVKIISTEYDETFSLPTPSKTGYTFAGWTVSELESTAMSGTSEDNLTSWDGTATTNSCFRNITSKNDATVIFTAKWNENSESSDEGENSFDLQVSSYGVATMYLDYAVKIPDDERLIGVAYVDDVTDSEMRLKRLDDYIPANTGVVVFASSGTYTFKETTKTLEALSDNKLSGVTEATDTATIKGESNGIIYCLGENTESHYVGFYHLAASQLPANKAYYLSTDANGVRYYSLGFSSGVSGIEKILNGNSDARSANGLGDGFYYNLKGQKVTDDATRLPNGIYIKNGRKVMVNNRKH